MKTFLSLLFVACNLCAAAAAQSEAPTTPTPNEPSAASGPVKLINDQNTPPKPGTNSSSRYVNKKEAARIPRFSAPPVIDGQMNDIVWQDAAVFGDFFQTQPGDNLPPSHPMEVYIGYDAKHLYVGFKVTQPRNTVRAKMGRRDDLGNEDFVGMYLDTFNDQQQAYFIFLNPYGIQTDGVTTEGRGEDQSVDIVMESKGQLTEDGYIVEAAIPFKSLRYEAGKDKQWGIHLFRRVRSNNNELQSWMPNNRSISGSLNQAGHITGLEEISTTRQLEINPSFTLSESGRRSTYGFNGDPAGRYVNESVKGEFGMTAKFSLTPTITLDFAYNPDFAQVEADAPISTANLRFPVFFPEKRPFFLERFEIFQSGLQVVNTRAIVDPDIAAKLTGRYGKNTFGIMYASDNGTQGNYSKDDRETLLICRNNPTANIDCPSERLLDKNADIGVFRFKRDIGKQNNLGFFATTYNFVDRHNNTAGFDGRWRFDKKTVAEFQVIGSNTRGYFYDPDLDKNEYRTGNGFGYRVWAERSGRNLYMNFLAQGRSPKYRADVGFNNRFDTNYLGSFVQYTTERDAKKSIIYKRIQNETNVSYDWQGRGQYFISNSQGMLALQRQTFVGMNLQFGKERVYESEFGAIRKPGRPGAFAGPSSERGATFKAFQAFLESTPNKQWLTNFFVDYTDGQMEYDFGAGPKFSRVSQAFVDYLAQCAADTVACQTLPIPGKDPGPGNQLTVEATIRYQPVTAFSTQLNYTKRRMIRHDTKKLAFDDNLFSWRSTYQFTRNTFARLRLDYSTLDLRIRPQFVAGWTPNPGTALYIGYNDDYNYNGYNPYTRIREPGFQGNGRTFFIKASYLFRKSF
ncbi:MAG TPA: carbohydrate binding family 9 domain-containing protein [Pyrinomonadaceae bacterium]|nr:carbohydrate binding family 9 domain-containing protein [Pyrinomonadaceae bacterium]